MCVFMRSNTCPTIISSYVIMIINNNIDTPEKQKIIHDTNLPRESNLTILETTSVNELLKNVDIEN